MAKKIDHKVERIKVRMQVVRPPAVQAPLEGRRRPPELVIMRPWCTHGLMCSALSPIVAGDVIGSRTNKLWKNFSEYNIITNCEI